MDVLYLIVVQEVVDDVLLQPLAEQPGEPDNVMVREPLLDESFDHPTMGAVGMQPGGPDGCVFVNVDRVPVHVDRREKDEPIGLDTLQGGQQRDDPHQVVFGFLVRQPLDRGHSCAVNDLEVLSFDVSDVFRVVLFVERKLSIEIAPNEASMADQRSGHHTSLFPNQMTFFSLILSNRTELLNSSAMW